MSRMNCRPRRPQHIPQMSCCPPPPCNLCPPQNMPQCPPCCPPPTIPCCTPSCPPQCETPAFPNCCPPICPPSCQPVCSPPCPPQCDCSLSKVAPLVGCCGREMQRCMPERLYVSGLPGGICTPLTLTGIESSREQPCINLRSGCRGPSPVIAEVTVPLIAWVCDANGCTHCGSTQIVLCVKMPSSCATCDGAFLANACVRLIESCRSCEPIFNVRLSVSAEVYMIRTNPCVNPCNPSNQCCFPQKPMFPQPFYPTW